MGIDDRLRSALDGHFEGLREGFAAGVRGQYRDVRVSAPAPNRRKRQYGTPGAGSYDAGVLRGCRVRQPTSGGILKRGLIAFLFGVHIRQAYPDGLILGVQFLVSDLRLDIRRILG